MFLDGHPHLFFHSARGHGLTVCLSLSPPPTPFFPLHPPSTGSRRRCVALSRANARADDGRGGGRRGGCIGSGGSDDHDGRRRQQPPATLLPPPLLTAGDGGRGAAVTSEFRTHPPPHWPRVC